MGSTNDSGERVKAFALIRQALKHFPPGGHRVLILYNVSPGLAAELGQVVRNHQAAIPSDDFGALIGYSYKFERLEGDMEAEERWHVDRVDPKAQW
jgi:hypothetical protein